MRSSVLSGLKTWGKKPRGFKPDKMSVANFLNDFKDIPHEACPCGD